MKLLREHEAQHVVTDSKTNRIVPVIICTDYHGLTVELPGGNIVVLDLSDGVFSVYCCHDNDPDVGEAVAHVDISGLMGDI